MLKHFKNSYNEVTTFSFSAFYLWFAVISSLPPVNIHFCTYFAFFFSLRELLKLIKLQVIQNLDVTPVLIGAETQPPIALQDEGILFPSRLCSFKGTHCWLLHTSLPRLARLQSSRMSFYSHPHSATAPSGLLSVTSPNCSTVSQTTSSSHPPNCCQGQSCRNISFLPLIPTKKPPTALYLKGKEQIS